MAVDRAGVSRWMTLHSRQLQVVAVSLLVIVAAIWIGRQSRTRAVALGRQLHSLQVEESRLSEWRSGFRAPDAREAAQLSADSALVLSVAIRGEDKMVTAQSIARLAEGAGLKNVQINFGPQPDSAYVTPRGQIGSTPTTVAAYVVTVDCTGSFASTLQFVSHVPPTLSVTRVSAVRAQTETKYRVVLTVYEVPNGNGSE